MIGGKTRGSSIFFTFHYASTYTPSATPSETEPTILYIPLCFYLYEGNNSLGFGLFQLYIPLCFYLYLTSGFRKSGNMFSLHSTMLLLIRDFKGQGNGSDLIFTFHYASTYTDIGSLKMTGQSSLHSTMLLLIRRLCSNTTLILSPLHSTMLLLIPCEKSWTSSTRFSLHSTMLLLILRQRPHVQIELNLYIPLCFYLYF